MSTEGDSEYAMYLIMGVIGGCAIFTLVCIIIVCLALNKCPFQSQTNKRKPSHRLIRQLAYEQPPPIPLTVYHDEVHTPPYEDRRARRFTGRNYYENDRFEEVEFP